MALQNIDLDIAPGEFFVIVGPSGCGKTTLLRVLPGLAHPTRGRILVGGTVVTGPGTDRGFVFQQDALYPWRSVLRNVGFGLELQGVAKAAARARAQAMIDLVGLNGFENRVIGTLSGGQMQRMLFARVLLQDARLIVLDEPFNAIDAKTSADLVALVERWHSEGRTVLAALHDMELVRATFPETLLLARGEVAWGVTAEVLTAENLAQARRMCEAFDDSAAACVVADAPSQAA